MPELTNLKWEHFAKCIATGFSIEAAQEAAGIAINRGNGSTLAARPDVAARIAEIQAGASKAFNKEIKKAQGDKVAFIAEGYRKLYMAVLSVEVRNVAEIKTLAETLVNIEKDKRVEMGGVSDRTEKRGAANNLAKLTDEELDALEVSLAALDDKPTEGKRKVH